MTNNISPEEQLISEISDLFEDACYQAYQAGNDDTSYISNHDSEAVKAVAIYLRTLQENPVSDMAEAVLQTAITNLEK